MSEYINNNKQDRIDITGIRYNDLIAIERDYSWKTKDIHWFFKCARCDRIVSKSKSAVMHGKIKTCGNHASELIKERPDDIRHKKRTVDMTTDEMLAYFKEIIDSGVCPSQGMLKYKLITHRLYSIHNSMIDRCRNPNNSRWSLYGGADIPVSVCDRWYTPGSQMGVIRFIYDAYQNGYYDQPKNTKRGDILSIDRWPNKNGNYDPTNVRWIPLKEQGQNVRTNRMICDGRETLIVSKFEEKYHLPSGWVSVRRDAANWTDDMVVWAAIHQELGLNTKHFSKRHFTNFRDVDGFMRLCPKIGSTLFNIAMKQWEDYEANGRHNQ